jgi:hypothetical protein
MQASLTGIRQSFTDIRFRWSNAKLKKSGVFWVAVGAIILTLFLGFTRGGWTTGGSAARSAQSAVVDRLVPICVAQFNADAQRAANLEELKVTTSYKRPTFVTEQGWATMPGETATDRQVASGCAKQIALIGE